MLLRKAEVIVINGRCRKAMYIQIKGNYECLELHSVARKWWDWNIIKTMLHRAICLINHFCQTDPRDQVHCLQHPYKLWKHLENISSVIWFNSAITFFWMSVIMSNWWPFSFNFDNKEQYAAARFTIGFFTKSLHASSHLNFSSSCKLLVTNFTQIFLFPKSVVIMDLIETLFIFSSLTIILQSAVPASKLHISSANFGLEVICNCPLRGSPSHPLCPHENA